MFIVKIGAAMATRAEARERTRESVIASADECFRATGFEATTIRQIAERADVSVGSVMAVGDKQSLLIEIFDRGVAAIHADPRRAARHDASSESVPKALLSRVRPFIELFVADPALSRRYAAVLIAGEHRSEVFSGLAETLIAEFTAVLERADHSPADAAARALALYHVYLGVLFSASAQGQRSLSGETVNGELLDAFSALSGDQVAL